MEIDSKLLVRMRDRFAMATYKLTGGYPLILNVECYQYFGQRVKIIGVNMYDTLTNAEVTVEASNMQRTQLDFIQLAWDYSADSLDELSKKSLHDIITGEQTAQED